MLLAREGGGTTALGIVNMFTGLASAAGSVIVSVAAVLYGVLAAAGILTCLYFRRDRHIWQLDQDADLTKIR